LNKGFARANGEVFGFLNADDSFFCALEAVEEFFRGESEMRYGWERIVVDAREEAAHVRAETSLWALSLWWRRCFSVDIFSIRSVPAVARIQHRECTSWDGELFVSGAEGAVAGYIDADLALPDSQRLHSGTNRLQMSIEKIAIDFSRGCGGTGA